MNEPGHYPPPNFGSPPPDSVHLPRASSFHPSMWSWCDTPSEPSWDRIGQAGWQNGAAAGFGFPPRPYGQNFGRGWHQGGRGGGRQDYGPAYSHRRKQKNKKEPEFPHFCDTCDRGFKNQEKYDEHVSQHVKCSVPDCSFMAHEKIVSIHWKHNHAPGAKRIKLDTPAEIAKWREERRKNYPTLQNIEKKKKVMELQVETGAVLETAQFGRMRGRGRGRGRGWGHRGFQGRPPRVTETPPPLAQRHRDGDPLGALASSDQDSDREDSAAEAKAGGLVVAPKQMSSALGSLMSNYGSLTESDEEPEAAPIQRAKDLVQENQALLNALPPSNQERGSSPKGLEAHKIQQPGYGVHTPSKRRRRGGRGGRGRHDTPQSRRPTLLEMLLAPDIRHERNVLLQCVRYVVRNNFFGLESRPQNQEGIKEAPASSGGRDGGESPSAALGGGSAEDGHQEALDTGEAVEAEQNCQDRVLQTDPAYSEPAEGPVDSAEISCSSNIYDDEIWEGPGAVV